MSTGHRDSQIPREVDVEAVEDCQVVAEELEGNDVENALETVDSPGYDDRLVLPAIVFVSAVIDSWVILAADDDGGTLSSGDLGQGVLNLGVQRVARHDNDYRHVLVNQRQRAVLQLAGENA